MYENPSTLEDCCLEVISDNINKYIECTKDLVQNDGPSEEESDTKFKFWDPDIFLINEISEKLLNRIVKKKKMTNALLNIFTNRNTKLKCIKIRDCDITKEGLMMLNQHKITVLEICNIKTIGISDILNCLNEWTIHNLVAANFSYCTFIDVSRYSFMVKITNFKNLRSLNLSYTELNQCAFDSICQDLVHLERMDISGTEVKDLTPLTYRYDTLISLTLCDLLNMSDSVVPILVELTRLRHLDVSLIHRKPQMMFAHAVYLELFENADALPELRSFDISGWGDVFPPSKIMKFIQNKPKMEYLGIVLYSAVHDPDFPDYTCIDYPKHLTVAGLGNVEQVIVTLQRYPDRCEYVQKALYNLFQFSRMFTQARPDVFNLVLPVMEKHKEKFGVQMAATACLYNLSRGELSKDIHPTPLSKAVHLTLEAMGMYPDEFQLQKNALLIICSDRILQSVNFNRFKCGKLVLDALCAYSEININRMCVAISSILASKITTEETSKLGGNPLYMNKLLALLKTRVESKTPDVTLKFTLSALWNLTDESWATSKEFLEQDGATLYLNALRAFNNNSTIETKVLGLLNNIAEVPLLRHHLMLDSIVSDVYSLVQSENIDVSYFAAGIVAHLASDGEERWTVICHSRNEVLTQLENAVSEWKVPESEMVAYRSFRPFLPLLAVEKDYQVQLWAVWAIHHVCSKNPQKYCAMLMENDGYTLIQTLTTHTKTHPEIKRLCNQILETLGNKKFYEVYNENPM